jgi:hypothetical protein
MGMGMGRRRVSSRCVRERLGKLQHANWVMTTDLAAYTSRRRV